MAVKRASAVRDKSYAFALRIVRVARELRSAQNEFVLGDQLLRSGTSIGANVEEADAAQSKKDFVAKMSIASKEVRETNYWLRLIVDSGLIARMQGDELLQDSDELIRLLTAIVKTAQSTP